jgi:hypothetical protein
MADRDRLSPGADGAGAAAPRREPNGRPADQKLRQIFGEMVRPQLSPFFEAQLRQRLARERQLRLVRRFGRVMAVYWMAVVLASAGILVSLPWPAFAASGTARAALLVILITVVVPLWVLLRVLRAGLFDTILGTFEAGRAAGRL